MANQFESLLEASQLADHKVILRAQLPILLAKVTGLRFAQLLLEWFGFVLDEDQKHWFALDGTEPRGSIQPGHTRGEVCVSALVHQTRQVVAQCFYSGSQKSERPAVGHLIAPTAYVKIVQTGFTKVSRLPGSLRTLVANLLESLNVKNMAAQLETFADKLPTLIRFLTRQMVL